ncbi:MAG: AMP-binding protein [Acidimicrobiales bacterium]|nr:AMP-binding protein [Acidimicrobiales bacterium]
MATISYIEQLRRLAAAHPERRAVTCGDEAVTYPELVDRIDDLAWDLRERGVEAGRMVTIALPNSVEWFVAFAAAWRLGATPQPVSSRLPQREIDAIVELADPPIVIGVPDGSVPGRLTLPIGYRAPARPAGAALADVVSREWKAPTSGGSTGRPKLIVSGDPAALDPDVPSAITFGFPGPMIMPGPLYHNGPLIWSVQGLLHGNGVVVLPRFDPEATLAAIQDHRGEVVYMVPTMMKRIWRLPEDVRTAYDLSSLKVLWHLAEPCPEWLKQVWIDWLGPERIVELYGGTEGQTATVISGVEWLAHRGSVGRPVPGSVQITDADGNALPPREMGEVWLKNLRDTPTYRYVGAEPRTREGGWESLGDMGWVDEDGYLYLGDRASDMILSGGANIYPAEVEFAIQEHPQVRSVAVIGLPDEDKGNTVHAIVEADADSIDEAELRSFLAERLVTYKIPRTFEFVDEALRDDAGKVRRSALRAARLPS